MALGNGLTNGNAGAPVIDHPVTFKPYTGAEAPRPGGGGGMGGGGEVGGPDGVDFGNVDAAVNSLKPSETTKQLAKSGLAKVGQKIKGSGDAAGEAGPAGADAGGPAGPAAGGPAEAAGAGAADLGGEAAGSALIDTALIGGIL